MILDVRPYIKLIHIMRSLEYKDHDDSMVAFRDLHDRIGQQPYRHPSVFSRWASAKELLRQLARVPNRPRRLEQTGPCLVHLILAEKFWTRSGREHILYQLFRRC